MSLRVCGYGTTIFHDSYAQLQSSHPHSILSRRATAQVAICHLSLHEPVARHATVLCTGCIMISHTGDLERYGNIRQQSEYRAFMKARMVITRRSPDLWTGAWVPTGPSGIPVLDLQDEPPGCHRSCLTNPPERVEVPPRRAQGFWSDNELET